MIIKISIIMKLWTAGLDNQLVQNDLGNQKQLQQRGNEGRAIDTASSYGFTWVRFKYKKNIFFSKLKIIPYIRKRRNRETGFNPIFSNSMSGHELAHPPVASTLPSPEFVWIVISNLSMPQICLVHRFEIVKALNLARPWFWVGQNLEFDKWFRICQGVEIVWSIILSLPKPWIFKPDV